MQPLSTLLFGKPLTTRGEDSDAEVVALGRSLDRILGGVMDLLGRETGETEAYAQAKREWGLLLGAEYNYAGIAARRAALLFALHALEPVRTHFARREPELVSDLETRVLPGKWGLGHAAVLLRTLATGVAGIYDHFDVLGVHSSRRRRAGNVSSGGRHLVRPSESRLLRPRLQR